MAILALLLAGSLVSGRPATVAETAQAVTWLVDHQRTNPGFRMHVRETWFLDEGGEDERVGSVSTFAGAIRFDGGSAPGNGNTRLTYFGRHGLVDHSVSFVEKGGVLTPAHVTIHRRPIEYVPYGQQVLVLMGWFSDFWPRDGRTFSQFVQYHPVAEAVVDEDLRTIYLQYRLSFGASEQMFLVRYTVELDPPHRIIEFWSIHEQSRGQNLLVPLEFGEVDGVWYPRTCVLRTMDGAEWIDLQRSTVEEFRLLDEPLDFAELDRAILDPAVALTDRRTGEARMTAADRKVLLDKMKIDVTTTKQLMAEAKQKESQPGAPRYDADPSRSFSSVWMWIAMTAAALLLSIAMWSRYCRRR